MYLEPALANMLYELIPEHKKYPTNDSRVLFNLNKAFYGCIESAKLW